MSESPHKKGKTIKTQQFFLNWNKLLTAMEADGIVEGFMNSIKYMHGLKFNKLIGNQ